MKSKKPKLPRVPPIKKVGGAHRVKKGILDRKKKYKSSNDLHNIDGLFGFTVNPY